MKKLLLSVILGMVLVSGAGLVWAQEVPDSAKCADGDTDCGYVMLAPLFKDQAGVGRRVTMAEYLTTIYKSMFVIAGVVASVVFTVSGFEYMMSETGGKKGAAKERMKNAIWGLLLAIFSYTILYTINPNLVNVSLKLEPIKGIKNGTDVILGDGTGPGGTGGQQDAMVEAYVRNQLTGISINHDACTYEGQKGCTNVAGLPQNAIDGVKTLNSNCAKAVSGCSLTITGGTESWGHVSHGPGIPVLDIDNTTSFNKYLTGNTKNPPDGTTATKDGATCKYEAPNSNANTTGTHWHCRW